MDSKWGMLNWGYSAGMSETGKQVRRVGLLLMGAYLLAGPAGAMLHELGHALPVWLTGGEIESIVIHPLSWSYTNWGADVTHPVLGVWSGSLFGFVASVLIFALVWRWRRPALAPLLLLGVLGGISNGVYLLGGMGDPVTLIEAGQPAWLVRGAGVAMVIVGFGMGWLALPALGVGVLASGGQRTLALLLGFGPWIAAMLMYQVARGEADLWYWLTEAAIALVLMPAAAWGSVWVDRWLSRWRDARQHEVAWRPGLVLSVAGVVICGAMIALAPSTPIELAPEDSMQQRLQRALIGGDEAEARELLSTMTTIDYGESSIALTVWAAAGPRVEGQAIVCLQALADHGVDMNLRGRGGDTALHHAARQGKFDVVRWLLAHGAEAGARDSGGRTAAEHAEQSRHTELASWLREREEEARETGVKDGRE